MFLSICQSQAWINKLFASSCFRRTIPPPSVYTCHITSTQSRNMNINGVTLRLHYITRPYWRHVTYLIFISKETLPVHKKNMSAPLRMSCCWLSLYWMCSSATTNTLSLYFIILQTFLHAVTGFIRYVGKTGSYNACSQLF